jgi:hypothetical protein
MLEDFELDDEDDFADVVANEVKVDDVILALLVFDDDPLAAGGFGPARHSALMMVMLSQPGVLGISVRASYQ